jgi:hypothetical protein
MTRSAIEFCAKVFIVLLSAVFLCTVFGVLRMLGAF